MKKRVLTIVAAVLLALCTVSSVAFGAVHGNSNKGGDVNSSEEALLKRFDSIMTDKAWMDSTHRKQYNEEARAALLDSRVDLDSAAEKEFNTALDDIDAILKKCSSRKDAWNHYGEISQIVNKVANKYKMSVSVDEVNKEATVTISDDVIANTGNVVKQTGFGLGQTAAVAIAAAAVLCVAFFVARKSNMHV